MKARNENNHPLRRRRWLAVAGATVAAVLPWTAAQASGEELRVVSAGLPPMVVNLPMVVSAVIAVSLAGWGLLALLERRTDRARRIWTTVAVAVLLISLVPLPTVEATTATRVYLALMHIAVGVVLIPGLLAGTAKASAAPVHTSTTA